MARVGLHLADVLREEGGLEVQVLSGEKYNGAANVELVAKGEVDLGISSTVYPAKQSLGLRTVLPVYPEIIVVLYNPSLGKPATLEELLDHRRVGLGPKELRHSKLMLELLAGFGIDTAKFTAVYAPFDRMTVYGAEMDVVVTIFGMNPEGIEDQLRRGAKLFSFDDFQLSGKGSRVDGFILNHPDFQSFLIPKNTFHQYPEEPVLTLAATVTIIARADLSTDLVYGIVFTLLENTHYLSQKDPLFGFLSQKMDATRLNFPLHEGTQQYLNRDRPTFLERYAKVIGLVFSAIFVLFGASGFLSSYFKKVKKDRIRVYYRAVHALERRELRNVDDIQNGIRELRDLKSQALKQLEEDRLEASESFSSFLNMVHYNVERLERELSLRLDNSPGKGEKKP